MKRLMLGNQAVAQGIYEAGGRFVSSYPGTPSTEITECAATYDEVYAEWAPNEKVALEAAFGASIAGARSFCGMKHVGLNVAADPLFTVSYTGVNAGLVIGVADDPGMHSSQNEQDSRHYAQAAKVLMLEPADSQECLEFTKAAFDFSEYYDTPVIIRLTTRIAHSQSLVQTGERQARELSPYKKDIGKYVMMPASARSRHVDVERRMGELRKMAEDSPLNRVERGGKIGIITSGVAYQYAREAIGDKASYLKLGIVNPLPEQLILDFAQSVDKLYIIEELDDVIETHVRKLGLDVMGKDLFSPLYEYTADMIRSVIMGSDMPPEKQPSLPGRPPVLCAGCPHRGVFYALSRLKAFVSGDIGCYTLGALPPLAAIDTTTCMGASVSSLHGYNIANPETAKKSVAVIGDSTFLHSGVTGLINIVYNNGVSTVIILDNSITGMTGHQQNPATGLTLKGEPAPAVDLEALCRACGVKRVRVVDPLDVKATQAAIREEMAAQEPSVIIARSPCVLIKQYKRGPAHKIDQDKCISCRVCMNAGCPAISAEGDVEIDETACSGCGLCANICPRGAIKPVGEEKI